MGIIDTFTSGIKKHFDKKKEQRELEERLRFEAEIQKRQIFQEEFRKNAFEVAKAQAFKEAAQKSGLAKLRAANRASRLNENNIEPGSFFDRLKSLTEKNKLRTTENMKRTAEMRKMGREMEQERLNNMRMLREERLARIEESRKGSSFGYG
jgi:hypothetical protein